MGAGATGSGVVSSRQRDAKWVRQCGWLECNRGITTFNRGVDALPSTLAGLCTGALQQGHQLGAVAHGQQGGLGRLLRVARC